MQEALGSHFGQQDLFLLSQCLTSNKDIWPSTVDDIVLGRWKLTITQNHTEQIIDITDRKIIVIDNIGCGQVHLRVKIGCKDTCPSFREGIG